MSSPLVKARLFLRLLAHLWQLGSDSLQAGEENGDVWLGRFLNLRDGAESHFLASL